jgi:prepilin-type N-terminal cleavage/methylation domain-containing protein
MRTQDSQRGFSLLELMIAIAIFTIVSGAALALFVQNEPVFTHQQNQAALNIAMRNSVAQLQLDVTNAGAGVYPNVPSSFNIPTWPVAVTIQNNVVSSTAPVIPCNTPATYTYGPNCFDQLDVITTDMSTKNTPPSHPSDSTGTNSVNISAGGTITMYLTPAAPTNPAPSPWPTAAALTALASDYSVGDEILLLSGGTAATQYSAVVLTSGGSVVGNFVKIQFASVTSTTVGSTTYYLNTTDPLNIAKYSNPSLEKNQFGPSDWVERLAPVIYQVDTSNPADPQLDRCIGSCAVSKTVLADQIIGFKVGAAYFDPASSDTCGDNSSTTVYTTTYYYNNNAAAPTGCSNMFTDIRAIQISLIGRTNPTDATTAENYRNGFDGGPYQIEALSAVINPRNLSMNGN